MVNVELPFRAVVPLHGDVPFARLWIARRVCSNAGHPDVQFHSLGIELEPVCELQRLTELLVITV